MVIEHMASQIKYSPIDSIEDTQQLEVILSQCFGISLTDWEIYFNRISRENFRIISQREQVIGGLCIYHMGQWYGGSRVPMAGIAAVGIAPEYRGTGVAYELLSNMLRELHSLQIPISALYPATQRLYRKVGYEQGGTRCFWELSPAKINLQDRHLPIYAENPVHYEVFQQIYKRQAQVNNGNLDRNQAIWENILESPKERTIYAYLFGSKTEPEGYIIFTQHRDSEGFFINIRDWVVLTPEAARCFWTFLADFRSQIDRVRWFGSPLNPFMSLLPEQSADISDKNHWMLRIVDIPLALSKRGYPQGIETELHLEIRGDELIPSNNDKFCLKISQGKGEVTKGGNGDFQINIRGLASLYTGLYTPYQLQQIGHLKTTKQALSTATLIFSSNLEPWMPDFF